MTNKIFLCACSAYDNELGLWFIWGDGCAWAISVNNRVFESKSMQKLLVCNSLHIFFLAEVDRFEIFLAQTSRKVYAIAKSHCSKFDGNRLRTEKQPG